MPQKLSGHWRTSAFGKSDRKVALRYFMWVDGVKISDQRYILVMNSWTLLDISITTDALPLWQMLVILRCPHRTAESQKGSHLFMRHPDGRTTLVTIHPGEKIGKGMIRKIINDAELTRDEWFDLIADI